MAGQHKHGIGIRTRVAAAWDASRSGPVALAIVILAVLVCVILSRPFMGSDEGNWAYQGRAWVEHGLPPYSGTVNNKPPGILILNAIAYRFCGPAVWCMRLLGALAIAGAAAAIYGLGRRFHSRVAGLLAMLIFGLAMSWDSVDGFSTAHPESFVALGEVIGLACVLAALATPRGPQRVLRVFAVGAALGAAMCFKQVAVLGALGVAALYVDMRRSGRWNTGSTAAGEDALAAFAGMAVAFAAFAAPVFWAGARPADFFECVFLHGFAPASWAGSIGVRALGFFQAWCDWRLVLLCALLILFGLRGRSLRRSGFPFRGLLTWLLLDFVGTNLGGWYYGHQLKQVLAPLALAAGVGLADCCEDPRLGLAWARRWGLPSLVGFGLVLTPWESVARALTRHPPKGDYNRNMGLWLRQRTADDERVFVLCGRAGPILVHSGRLTPGRHFLTHFVGSEANRLEFLRDFALHPPMFVVIPHEPQASDESAPLANILQTGYRFDSEVEECDVYVRNERGPGAGQRR